MDEAEFQTKTCACEGYNPNFNLDYVHIWHVPMNIPTAFLLLTARGKMKSF